MNDIIDAISTRIKAPYFGYVVLAFIGFNWRGIFLLMVMSGSPEQRLAAFDDQTSLSSLVIYPFLIGAAVTLISPWLRFFFSFISQKPFQYLDGLLLTSDHEKIIKKTELEKLRTELFANKETELIDRAKRDADIRKIEDLELQKRVEREIEAIRNERDGMSDDHSIMHNLSSDEKVLVKAAAKNGRGEIYMQQSLNEPVIKIGAVVFGAGGNKQFAKYEFVLQSLIQKGLVTQKSKGFYGLTHNGWLAAEEL